MTASVPTLSLKAFTGGDAADRAAFSDALMRSLQDYGFFILKDHDVSTALLEAAYDQAVAAFALPTAVKKGYAAGLRGYISFGVEHAKDSPLADLKEFWQIGHEPPPEAPVDEPFPPNAWPDRELPSFRPTFLSLFHALNDTGVVLLRALAPKLGLDEHHFDPLVRFGTSILRVLHYPPLRPEDDPQALRAAAHEDINFLTIMVAAKGSGLELLDREGNWLPVETEPTDLIVDSGDMLQRMTNGVIPSTTHRVINPQGPNVDRYSMPFFMHPTRKTSLAVLPSCLGEGARYPETTAGDYLDERLRALGLKT
jgi:isopenicillin N synthase-like dioxygenase